MQDLQAATTMQLRFRAHTMVSVLTVSSKLNTVHILWVRDIFVSNIRIFLSCTMLVLQTKLMTYLWSLTAFNWDVEQLQDTFPCYLDVFVSQTTFGM